MKNVCTFSTSGSLVSTDQIAAHKENWEHTSFEVSALAVCYRSDFKVCLWTQLNLYKLVLCFVFPAKLYKQTALSASDCAVMNSFTQRGLGWWWDLWSLISVFLTPYKPHSSGSSGRELEKTSISHPGVWATWHPDPSLWSHKIVCPTLCSTRPQSVLCWLLSISPSSHRTSRLKICHLQRFPVDSAGVTHHRQGQQGEERTDAGELVPG